MPEDVFRLETPEFAGGVYSARRHSTGGGRQDTFEFSGATEKEPLLGLLIYQPGSEATPDSSFFVELARRAAESGRGIIRAGQPVEMATRFGAFEVARLGLAQDGAAAKDCLGFRFANAEPALRISGFACGAPEIWVSSIFSPHTTYSAARIASSRALILCPHANSARRHSRLGKRAIINKSPIY